MPGPPVVFNAKGIPRECQETPTMASRNFQDQELVFHVTAAHYDKECGSWSIIIDDGQGIENPHDKREFIIIRIMHQDNGYEVWTKRAAFFRNDVWLVQGTIKKRHLTLFKDE